MPFIIGTAGHIDHGKTSLIRTLTGMDTDRLKEEKERGISIDLGFAYLDLPDGAKAGIVDVPGHERFIKNMLAGATGIDLVLFVVAADDGIMPQTKEHLEIMHLLGICRGIFVITKTDLVEKGRVDQVTQDVKGLIKGSSLEGSPVIPISSATGSGIDVLKTLIAKEARNIPARPEAGFFRLAIDRSFSIKGFGTVVTGTVASGSIKKSDEALLFSKKKVFRPVKIRGIQSHFTAVEAVYAGQRAAINLSGISHAEIERGDVLTSPDLDSTSTIVAVSFEFLNSIKKPIKNNSMFKLHHMTDETIARVSFEGIKEAAPGAKTFGFLRLKEPMAMMRGDRFILRDPSINSTIGGGKALLPYVKRGQGGLLEQYQILDSGNTKTILLSLLSGRGVSGIDSHTIRLMLNLSQNSLKTLIHNNEDIAIIGENIILKKNLDDIEQSIVSIINNYHTNMSADLGINEEYLFKKIPDSGFRISDLNAEVIKAVMDNLVKSGRIARAGNVFHLPSYRPQAKGIEKEVEGALLSLFSNNEFNPIKKQEITLSRTYKKEDIEKTFQLLLKRGMIFKITEESYISKDTLDEAKNKLINWIAEKGKIKAAEFRDALGCGRKFAIELLEYFDKEKITLRSGDYRVLRKALSAKQ